MKWRTCLRATILAISTAGLVVGCSDSKKATVTGTILVDGQPPEKGSVTMILENGQGPTAGGEIVNGKYTVSDAPVGKNKVEIRVSKIIGEKQLYGKDSPKVPTYGQTLPPKYNTDTELRYEVHPGTNEKNWELSGK